MNLIKQTRRFGTSITPRLKKATAAASLLALTLGGLNSLPYAQAYTLINYSMAEYNHRLNEASQSLKELLKEDAADTALPELQKAKPAQAAPSNLFDVTASLIEKYSQSIFFIKKPNPLQTDSNSVISELSLGTDGNEIIDEQTEELLQELKLHQDHEDQALLEALETTFNEQIAQVQFEQEKKLGSTFLSFIKPVNIFKITSRYGWRHGRPHRGTDFAAPTGTPILAAADGKVVFSNWYYGYGKLITVEHANGVHTRYGHCSAMLVKPGQVVKKGQMIGRVGSTGRSSGPHVHFEVLAKGFQLNPERYLFQNSDSAIAMRLKNKNQQIALAGKNKIAAKPVAKSASKAIAKAPVKKPVQVASAIKATSIKTSSITNAAKKPASTQTITVVAKMPGNSKALISKNLPLKAVQPKPAQLVAKAQPQMSAKLPLKKPVVTISTADQAPKNLVAMAKPELGISSIPKSASAKPASADKASLTTQKPEVKASGVNSKAPVAKAVKPATKAPAAKATANKPAVKKSTAKPMAAKPASKPALKPTIAKPIAQKPATARPTIKAQAASPSYLKPSTSARLSHNLPEGLPPMMELN